MTRRLLILCLLLSLAAVCPGQQQKTAAGGEDQKGEARLKSRRLATLRDTLYWQMLGSIKAMDEPALRAFLRLRFLTYVWGRKSPTSLRDAAESMAAEAVGDLEEHSGEVPDKVERHLRNDLLAQIQLHAPELAARLIKKYKLNQGDSRDQLGEAFSLLNAKGGAVAAAASLRRTLADNQDAGPSLIFFFARMEQQKPDEIPGLLSELLAAEERAPGSLSLGTLYWMNSFYLREQNPPALKTRFLAAALKATQNGQALSETGQLEMAHTLLGGLLPVIEKLAPALYSQAAAQSAAIRSRLPQAQFDLEAVRARVKQSADPLEAMIAEAEAPGNRALRDGLLSEAAQLALEKGKLELATDLATRIEIKGGDDNTASWRDQFLGDVVSAALERKEPATAERAASKVESPLKRASEKTKLALYFLGERDPAAARETMDEALKLASSADDGPAKAIAYLDLSKALIKVDDTRIPEVMLLAVKVINNIPRPGPGDKPGGATRDRYVDALTAIAWNAIPVFQNLAQDDEAAALSLADKIQLQEIKGAAIFGVYTGLGTMEPGDATKLQERKKANGLTGSKAKVFRHLTLGLDLYSRRG